MVSKILPPLDHIVKKDYGPLEACIFTRFCPLVIGLPFYFFTIWMTVVIVLRSDKGISVIQEICADDFECTNAFAMGRAQFDKEACLDASCSSEQLQARSGQKPLHFPRLGLGDELEPETSTISYNCVNVVNGTCVEVEECGCDLSAGFVEESAPLNCGATDCLDDLSDTSRSVTCTNDECTTWEVSTDSAKQFSFQECECSNDDCSTFDCETFVMPYYYPNVFYAGLATILFVLPVMIAVYVVIKTQLRKIFPCKPKEMYVYDQAAGMQDEFKADNLVTGGFNEEQTEKAKYRSCGFKDVAALIVGPLIILFFSWQIILVSGRVGLSFICLAVVLIILVEIYKLVKLCRKQRTDMADRQERNNPDAFRAEF